MTCLAVAIRERYIAEIRRRDGVTISADGKRDGLNGACSTYEVWAEVNEHPTLGKPNLDITNSARIDGTLFSMTRWENDAPSIGTLCGPEHY